MLPQINSQGPLSVLPCLHVAENMVAEIAELEICCFLIILDDRSVGAIRLFPMIDCRSAGQRKSLYAWSTTRCLCKSTKCVMCAHTYNLIDLKETKSDKNKTELGVVFSTKGLTQSPPQLLFRLSCYMYAFPTCLNPNPIYFPLSRVHVKITECTNHMLPIVSSETNHVSLHCQ